MPQTRLRLMPLGFRYPNATFSVEPLPAEFVEALDHAKSIYDFVLMLLPDQSRP